MGKGQFTEQQLRTVRNVGLCLLAVTIVAVFWQTSGFGFVNLDDPAYVYQNPWVLRGITKDGVVWALSGFHVANWHPLTWLSHMLDVELFGADAGRHHLVNVAFHALNTFLLFRVLRDATGAAVRSLVVAALFAVHPLHVESVAWISERKDVLSTAFLLLTLGAYVRYARTGRRLAYVATGCFLALGLLAKPMLVTAPFLLLLLDFWPLNRLPLDSGNGFARALGRRAAEKLPLFGLSVCASIVTYLAQSAGGGAASAVSHIPVVPRVANALVSYVAYLVKTVWPTSLSSFYPHPATVGAVHLGLAAGAALLLVAITGWVWRERLARPYLAWGWCWYLGTLVPVIGFVQVGGQAMADRYTYVPLIGVFVAAVWGASEALSRLRVPHRATAAGTVAVIGTFAVIASRDVGYWRDSLTLHQRAIAVTDRNWRAWQGVCDARLHAGAYEDAVSACRAAIEILPTFPEAWQTLGTVYGRMGDQAAALRFLGRALELRPDYFNAVRNIGAAHGNLGEYAEAVAWFRRALRLQPDDAETWADLAVALKRSGEDANAAVAYERAARLDPALAVALSRRLGR